MNTTRECCLVVLEEIERGIIEIRSNFCVGVHLEAVVAKAD